MPQQTIPILMYHQVDTEPPKGSPMRGLVVSPKTFARQMAALHALGYVGKSMGDLMPYLKGQNQGKVFGITFDDGYQNNLRCALPVLKRYGFTSTCYIVVNQVGKTNGWDKERGVIQVPLMTAEELQAWVDAGQEVGSHTLNHVNLAESNPAEQTMEIVQSKDALEAMIDQKRGVQHFCYPYGGLNEAAVKNVKAAGYLTATTTVRGRAVAGQSDDLLLPRVLVSRTTTWMQVLLKCLSRYEDKRGTERAGKASKDIYAA
jgi:peptidoglycan/xylan/chitin deacetylase (PgdA/CDA1 family)